MQGGFCIGRNINKNIYKSSTDRDRALFEAGIKLGALYHQFVGTPVSAATVESLQQAIQESIALQPYVEAIKVRIDKKIVEEKINRFGYCELDGRMLRVELTVKYGRAIARVGLKYDSKLDYPLMRIIAVKELKSE